LGKFCKTISELLWGESVGWGDVSGGFGKAIGFRTGVIGVNAHWLVGGVRVGREIRSFKAVENGDGGKKRGEKVFR
jgi:hypothetical protein